MHFTNVFPMSFATLLFYAGPAVGLDTACAPGGNFDLSYWKLQLPTGEPKRAKEIPSQLLQGCDGYKDKYFFTSDTDGSLIMNVPGSPQSAGCVTTPGSK